MKRDILKSIMATLARLHKAGGFGIQSPTDFSFANDVINGKGEYYAYEELTRAGKGLEGEKTNKMLFRLCNFIQPDIIITYKDTDKTATAYLHEACRHAQCICMTEANATIDAQIENKKALIHFSSIASAEEIDNAMRQMPAMIAEGSALIVENIDDKEKKNIWKKLKQQDCTHKTFDLYDIGIALTGKDAIRKHYKLLF